MGAMDVPVPFSRCSKTSRCRRSRRCSRPPEPSVARRELGRARSSAPSPWPAPPCSGWASARRWPWPPSARPTRRDRCRRNRAVKNVLWLAVAPRMTPGLLAQEQVFRATLKAGCPRGHGPRRVSRDDHRRRRGARGGRGRGTWRRSTRGRSSTSWPSSTARAALRRAPPRPPVPRRARGLRRGGPARGRRHRPHPRRLRRLAAAGLDGHARRRAPVQPDLEQVVVVTGASAIDRSWEATARAQLGARRGNLAITYMGGLSIEAAMERVAALPARTAVLLGAFLRDGAGRDFRSGDRRSLDLVVGASRIWDQRAVHRPRGGRRTRRELGGPGRRQAEIGIQLCGESGRGRTRRG